VDPLGMNKWAAAAISGLLLIMVIRSVSEGAFHEDLEGPLPYAIEVASADAGGAIEIESGPSFNELLAMANLDRGPREFAKCKACHTLEKGGKDGTGPNLYNIVGRAIAGVDGFKYSNALAEKGGVWDYEALDAWLASPKSYAPGTSMSFAGIRKDTARADLVAYLRSFSDDPMALPAIEPKENVVLDAEGATESE